MQSEVDPERRNLDCLGSLATHLLKEGDRDVVAVSRVPDRAYADAVSRSGGQFIVALADPRRAALYLNRTGGWELVAAIRIIGGSSACLAGVLASEGASIMRADDAAADPTSLASRLLAALRLPAGAGEIARAVEIVSGRLASIKNLVADEPDVSDALRAALPEEGALAVEAALAGYVSAFAGGPLGRITATRSLFYSTEANAPLSSPVVDVTGRARCLIYGPYIQLPQGDWTVRLVLAFPQEVVGTPFTLEVSRGDRSGWSEVGRMSFIASLGRYVGQVSFNHRDPSATLQFKLFIDKAAFDGRVSLGFAELQRLDDETLGDIEWRPYS